MGAILKCLSFRLRKMVNEQNWTKMNKKGAKEYTDKKVPIVFGYRMKFIRNYEVKRGYAN